MRFELRAYANGRVRRLKRTFKSHMACEGYVNVVYGPEHEGEVAFDLDCIVRSSKKYGYATLLLIERREVIVCYKQ
jgi:hypothetical protein